MTRPPAEVGAAVHVPPTVSARSHIVLIYAAGFGLVTLGHWARSRRRDRTRVAVA